jgi:hypothetical protein
VGGVLPGFEEEEEEALFQPSWAQSPHRLSSLGDGSPLPVRSARLPDLPRRWGSLGGGSPCFSLGSLGGSPFGAGAAAPRRSDSLMRWVSGGSLGGGLSPLPLGAGAAAPRSNLEVLGGLCEVSPQIPLAGMAEPPPVQRLRLRFSDSLGGGEASSLGSPLFAAAPSPPLYLGSPFRMSSLGGAAASPPVALPRFDSSGGVNLDEALAASSLQ